MPESLEQEAVSAEAVVDAFNYAEGGLRGSLILYGEKSKEFAGIGVNVLRESTTFLSGSPIPTNNMSVLGKNWVEDMNSGAQTLRRRNIEESDTMSSQIGGCTLTESGVDHELVEFQKAKTEGKPLGIWVRERLAQISTADDTETVERVRQEILGVVTSANEGFQKILGLEHDRTRRLLVDSFVLNSRRLTSMVENVTGQRSGSIRNANLIGATGEDKKHYNGRAEELRKYKLQLDASEEKMREGVGLPGALDRACETSRRFRVERSEKAIALLNVFSAQKKESLMKQIPGLSTAAEQSVVEAPVVSAEDFVKGVVQNPNATSDEINAALGRVDELPTNWQSAARAQLIKRLPTE